MNGSKPGVRNYFITFSVVKDTFLKVSKYWFSCLNIFNYRYTFSKISIIFLFDWLRILRNFNFRMLWYLVTSKSNDNRKFFVFCVTDVTPTLESNILDYTYLNQLLFFFQFLKKWSNDFNAKIYVPTED